ncbi:MAG: helix-turn-helix domain-containing protein, partial [Pseudomonadota bacterium]
AFDGFQGLDLVGPLEAFEQANDLASNGHRRYETLVITRNGKPAVADTGIILSAHTSIEQCPPLHTLIVSGGAGARRQPFPRDSLRWLAHTAPRLSRYGSICTGLFILAQTGLLNGRSVTTHWQHVDEARARFPTLNIVSDALFLRQGRSFTAAGVSAGIDLALALIEEDHGPAAAADVARHLVVFFKRPGDQRQYSSMLRHQTESADEFANLVAWIADNLSADLSSPALAERVGLSERQFRRRFAKVFGETPTQRIERIRVEAACTWLGSETAPVEQIAFDLGYRSADTFRRAFERHRGITPTEYRSRFGVGVA